MLKFNSLPTIRAQIALSYGDAASAIEFLRSAAPYELGNIWLGSLGPIYIRSEAYLAAHRGIEAAGEI